MSNPIDTNFSLDDEPDRHHAEFALLHATVGDLNTWVKRPMELQKSETYLAHQVDLLQTRGLYDKARGGLAWVPLVHLWMDEHHNRPYTKLSASWRSLYPLMNHDSVYGFIKAALAHAQRGQMFDGRAFSGNAGDLCFDPTESWIRLQYIRLSLLSLSGRLNGLDRETLLEGFSTSWEELRQGNLLANKAQRQRLHDLVGAWWQQPEDLTAWMNAGLPVQEESHYHFRRLLMQLRPEHIEILLTEMQQLKSQSRFIQEAWEEWSNAGLSREHGLYQPWLSGIQQRHDTQYQLLQMTLDEQPEDAQDSLEHRWGKQLQRLEERFELRKSEGSRPAFALHSPGYLHHEGATPETLYALICDPLTTAPMSAQTWFEGGRDHLPHQASEVLTHLFAPNAINAATQRSKTFMAMTHEEADNVMERTWGNPQSDMAQLFLTLLVDYSVRKNVFNKSFSVHHVRWMKRTWESLPLDVRQRLMNQHMDSSKGLTLEREHQALLFKTQPSFYQAPGGSDSPETLDVQESQTQAWFWAWLWSCQSKPSLGDCSSPEFPAANDIPAGKEHLADVFECWPFSLVSWIQHFQNDPMFAQLLSEVPHHPLDAELWRTIEASHPHSPLRQAWNKFEAHHRSCLMERQWSSSNPPHEGEALKPQKRRF